MIEKDNQVTLFIKNTKKMCNCDLFEVLKVILCL